MRREHVELYTDTAGCTRWRWTAANAKVLGDSGEGYTEPLWCVKQARRLAEGLGIQLVDNRRR